MEWQWISSDDTETEDLSEYADLIKSTKSFNISVNLSYDEIKERLKTKCDSPTINSFSDIFSTNPFIMKKEDGKQIIISKECTLKYSRSRWNLLSNFYNTIVTSDIHIDIENNSNGSILKIKNVSSTIPSVYKKNKKIFYVAFITIFLAVFLNNINVINDILTAIHNNSFDINNFPILWITILIIVFGLLFEVDAEKESKKKQSMKDFIQMRKAIFSVLSDKITDVNVIEQDL